MGRVALGVMVWVAIARSIAVADDDAPTATPAAAETNWYTNTRPATAADAPGTHTWRKFRVHRSGLFALGGVTRMTGQFFARVDLGMPVPTRRFPRLRAVVAIETRYDEDGSGAQTTSMGDLAVTPEVQYDWRLPFTNARGDFMFVIGVGLRRAQHWVRLPEEPYWPSTWESSTLYALQLDVALQFRGHNGLLVSLVPLGIASPLNTPKPPDARWMTEDPERTYALALGVGYQLP